MFKKAIPLVLISGLVLTGCGTNDDVPNNNETPMENLDDNTRDITPDVNEQTGPDMDGMDNGGDDGIINDNNGDRDGIINDDGNGANPGNGIMNDGNTDTDKKNEMNNDNNNNNNNN